MSIPYSCRRDLERFEKKMLVISKMARDTTDAQYDFQVDLHELIQAMSHFLDRLMDSVWTRYGKTAAGKKKPNIYFPDCDSEAAFMERLASLQLSGIDRDSPRIFRALRDVQPGLGSKGNWLRTLKKLANLKHERPLDVKKLHSDGIALGVNQSLYIHRLSILDGRMDFQGQAFNSRTGAPEPVKVQFVKSFHDILEIAEKDPIDFVRESIGHLKELALVVHADEHNS
ncbi:hypothetical protein LPW26_14870 [Rhodopseudomonas sp. HC1]|uniref:hypothetical protein n=1 Tax=Rhodopseudomonas infernalis TaxID=2897386 RepID=UPI001EE87D59|nr:hypothetical protein [Rhodopseudomonas infernalis]MCG6205932.1 hypothetical protein [Rhodopseudomonas infernalis]